MESFANRLKQLRTEKGLTYRDLSKNVVVAVGSLHRWENNMGEINSADLVK